MSLPHPLPNDLVDLIARRFRAIGAGSVAGIVLFVIAAVLLATSAVGFCALYRLIRFDSRGHRPLTH